ncbi:class I SAM-dependent methyltransferase [Clostridium sp. UBA7503]|uniref:class I SAM-dependent methyltransferase n=1 Tax=Clostridium sp. UBA7503 TaxID=1946377 RepID=UPI003217958E
MSLITEFYERYDEENRLTLNNARKIEFTVTTTILNEQIKPHNKILELGAGTGAYSFYYAEKGNEVVATDIVPKHVEIIKEKLKENGDEISLSAEVVNSIDLSQYESESFDVVTCLGPMYHLKDENDRIKCIHEALRVLKPGGVLAIAYINKHYIIHVIMAYQKQFFTHTFINEVLSSGVTKEGGVDCFLPVGFFTTPTEIESFIENFNIEIISHVATDGLCSLLRDPVNELSEEQYEAWKNYMLKSCREKSILGLSNHGLLVCRKQ